MSHLVDAITEEVASIIQVQHLRLQPDDVLAFVVTGHLSNQDALRLRSEIKAQLPVDGVKVCVINGGYFAVLPEAPEGVDTE